MIGTIKVCPKCKDENSSDSVYCRKCGTNLAGQSWQGDLSRQVIDRAREEAIGRGVSWTFDKVIGPLLASVAPAVLLTIIDGSRTFWNWLLLTWPLTAAVAVSFVLVAHPLRNSGWLTQSIVVVGILWLATVVGTSASGTPINFTPVIGPRPPLGYGLGILAGFSVAYGSVAFTLSIIAGALVGWLCLALLPEET